MNKRLLAGAIVIAVIIISAVALYGTGTYNQSGNSAASGSPSGQVTTNSTKTLFSSTSYYPYSYQIYPGQISSQAQSALSGFNLTSRTFTNGTAIATITIVGTNQSQPFTLKQGYKLYIIETSYGDDGYRFDSSLSDDGFVVVDSNGYVVS